MGSCCFCCEAGQLLAACLRPVPGGESAGCVACSGLVLQAVFACRVTFAMPYPLPFSTVCPRSSLLCPVLFILLCPCSFPCAPGSAVCYKPTVCKLRELSRWQLQHGPAVAARAPVPFRDSYLFPAEFMILGHGSSVNYKDKELSV